ncbi:adenosylcobinamide-phosphate synthase CbiB [Hydrogenophaga defluvii]|uniref:Cobalamin biosynthesis protein CobD n=1 Tax=Hydrogenophaga defluvii TaxID=249410 RepID=A0ABW2SH10_9BURK
MAVTALAMLIALAVDRLWGEPPARWHPVVAMGRYLGCTGARVAPTTGQTHRPWRVFLLGALAWALGATLVVVLAAGVVTLVREAPPLWQALLLGLLLKPLLAWRLLHEEVWAVETALAQSLDAGRARLAWLVSRDVTALTDAEVRESAIESLAENLNDSVVAPLFWFVIGGLPGAALYRFANTADAMWGYQEERQGRDWTWAGKWAARADDVLSWVPARLTALLLVLWRPWRMWWHLPREARLTPSPNSGWPMAAMALSLGVRLGKPGVYTLNAEGRAPGAADTEPAILRATRAVQTVCAGALLCLVWEGLQ